MRLYSICLTYVKKNIEQLDISKLPDDILRALMFHDPSILIAESNIRKISQLDYELLKKFDIFVYKQQTNLNSGDYYTCYDYINDLDYHLPENINVAIQFRNIKNGRAYGDFAILNDYHDIS